MKKGIITVLLAICILISALPFAQVDAASAAENARLQSYEQFLAYYYQTYSLLDYLMENSDSPCRTIVNNADEDLEGALEIWRKATMDVGDLAKYSEKEIEFYEFLIFDILYQKNALDLGLKNAETAVNVLQSEILNEYAELGLDMTLLTKVTEENADELLNKLIHFDNLKFLSGNFEALRKAMGYVADVGELSEKLYILLEMNNCSEVVHDILNQLYQKSTDSAMKEACRRVSLISTGLITEAEIIAVFSGRVVLQEAASHVMDKIWGDIVSSTSLGRALSIGKKVGKLTSNIMFGTDAVVENWYSMKQLNTFETVMKSVLKSYQSSYNSSPTYQNALLFNKAADMYMRTHSVGSEYALKYAEVAMGGGFFGWIYKNFTHKDDYEHLIGTLNSIKTNVDCAIDFVNNNTYNFYLDELEACDSAVPAWKPTPTVVTREEVDQKTEEMPELFFRTTNQTTSTSVTYADDKLTYADYTHTDGTLKLNGNTLTIYGDLYLTGGTIDLWTGTLIVRGNVYQSGGSMLINKGRLEIGGDYRIQKRNVDEWGVVSYGGSYGVMRMQYPEDFVAVGRSFVTQSNSGNGSSGNLYSAGTMEIGGDFIQLKHSSSTVSEQNFAASGTHKVILNGAGAQTVSFQSNSSGFNYLEMDQASDVTFKDYLRVNAMHSNGSAKSVGLNLWNFGINGKSLTIVGDMSISGNVDLKLGNLNIDGNVAQTNGIVVLNKGRLTTTGDYRIQKRNVDEWGVVSYSGSYGVMRMQYPEDFVAVGGSFVTQSNGGNGTSSNLYSAGTMEIGGDFIQKEHSTAASDQNFAASGTHKVILNGTGLQKVTFQSTSSGFNILDLHRTPTNEYRFSRVPCWKTLLDYGKAHEHDLVSDVTVPTCTKGGFTTYSCYCGHSVVSDYTDALGHNETVDAPVAPGCERTGLTEGAHCDRCGLVLTAQEEIPALGHDHQRGICIRCGDSIVTASGWSGATQWVLTQEGELIVYGQGNMKNYGWTGGQPWVAYAGQVRSVVIEQGVKQVGSGAFKDMTSLESVLLPTSLKTIGIAAFYGCTALEEIVIPEGIYTVWEYTFKNCTSLETVSLPNTLIKIDQGAFEACTALGELYLPANVNIIGGWSFKGCTALTAVDMHDAVATEIRAGAFKNCTSLTNVILPGNIRTLGDSCFYGIGAEEFVLPTTVDNIGPWCFARSQLRQVTFEGDAPAIGEGAFNKITLTAYYPAGNATWNSMNMLNYGGTITWTAK